jgi:excisionase family DNA binding protein
VSDLAENRLAVPPLEAARLLSLGRTKFYELIDSGDVASFKSGGGRLIPVSALHDYIQRQLVNETALRKDPTADTSVDPSKRSSRRVR